LRVGDTTSRYDGLSPRLWSDCPSNRATLRWPRKASTDPNACISLRRQPELRYGRKSHQGGRGTCRRPGTGGLAAGEATGQKNYLTNNLAILERPRSLERGQQSSCSSLKTHSRRNRGASGRFAAYVKALAAIRFRRFWASMAPTRVERPTAEEVAKLASKHLRPPGLRTAPRELFRRKAEFAIARIAGRQNRTVNCKAEAHFGE